jgi:cytochrome oxidase Cu insertion factor (SCO1/SenC/PrrC family)
MMKYGTIPSPILRVSSMLAVALAISVTGAPSARAEFPRDKPAPAFTLKQLDGKPLSLSSLKGKIVLLDFWGPS